jgi:hypothetical protein
MVFRFGRTAADHLLPRHLSAQAIEQCKFEETGDTARATLPDGSIMPLIKINSHWKLSLNEFCRVQGKTEAEIFKVNARSAFILSFVTTDLLDGRYHSPSAVIASINARGLAFLPDTLGHDEGEPKITATTKE